MAKRHEQADMTPGQQKVLDRAMTNAIRLWDAELIRSCVESGASVQELLVRAIDKRSPDMVKLAVTAGADVFGLVGTDDKTWMPVLHYAHENFNEEIVRYILERGVPVDHKSPMNETVAEVAVRKGEFDKMKFYLALGADLDHRAQEIMFAGIDRKNPEMVSWAVEHGADVRARRLKNGVMMSALHCVSDAFHEDIANFFLQKGVSVDVKTSAGDTPLIMAAKAGDLKRAEFFLKNDADPLALNHAGLSAVDEAYKRYEASRSSYDRNAYSSSPPRITDKDMLKLLLARVKELHGQNFSPAIREDLPAHEPIAFKKKPPTP